MLAPAVHQRQNVNTLRYVSTSHSAVIHQALEDVITHAHQFGNRPGTSGAHRCHLNGTGRAFHRSSSETVAALIPVS